MLNYNHHLILLYNSNAAKPPETCETIYGNKSFIGIFPIDAIIKDTTGLKLPPDIQEPIYIANIKAPPIAKASLVDNITYKKKNVPINSTKYLFILFILFIF